ncbi:hypothetical protein ACH5RR_008906 [Cinchona calisaya]|uniref:Uncharacterized protein n=1 Tax=Cinchona calisaya TaxID=153742 RepID=A0ABD3AD28_9GENT
MFLFPYVVVISCSDGCEEGASSSDSILVVAMESGDTGRFDASPSTIARAGCCSLFLDVSRITEEDVLVSIEELCLSSTSGKQATMLFIVPLGESKKDAFVWK